MTNKLIIRPRLRSVCWLAARPSCAHRSRARLDTELARPSWPAGCYLEQLIWPGAAPGDESRFNCYLWPGQSGKMGVRARRLRVSPQVVGLGGLCGVSHNKGARWRRPDRQAERPANKPDMRWRARAFIRVPGGGITRKRRARRPAPLLLMNSQQRASLAGRLDISGAR